MNYRGFFDRSRVSSESEPESAEALVKLESLLGVPLPSVYRAYLQEIGKCDLDAWVPCTEMTPFGEDRSLIALHGVKDVINLLDSDVTPRNMICIGYGHNGATTCLSIAGIDHGQVFALDAGMRYYWDDIELASMPHLAPEIREFFRLRDDRELPTKPWGYENCYHIADSFDEFLLKIKFNE